MSMTLTAPETLTASEAAELLACSPSTVRRLADLGVLPAWRLTTTSPRRFTREDIDELLERARAGRPVAA
jgi:excisionase family DNA binding protein